MADLGGTATYHARQWVIEFTEVTALTLENADATLERDARLQLVGAGEIDDPASLGTQAGAALRGAVYRHVAIWTEGERDIVECRTYSGGVHRTAAIGSGEIDRRLDESGVGHHRRASAFGARRIREALHDACRTGVGHQKVWETGMAPPAVTDKCLLVSQLRTTMNSPGHLARTTYYSGRVSCVYSISHSQ